MTALNDAERAAIHRDAEGGANRSQPLRFPKSSEYPALEQTSRYPAWLPSRRFIAAVIAIGGMQLLATMDSTVAIVALPRIQDELSLSDAGRSWVITAYVLTFGGLMLLGGRLGDTIGRKRTFIVGVALFTIASILCGLAWNETTLVTARLLQGVGSAPGDDQPLALPERTATPDDVALLLFTSGTSARPKLVPLSQRNLCVSAQDIAIGGRNLPSGSSATPSGWPEIPT